ncbi:MAG: hypothetical protein KAR06_12750 [Deltaproteobacteria bacterium]|nr:hypothetical protein [Deltaproteobacteria bacterium]
MSKIQIIGTRTLLDECIRTMHALSVVHIENVHQGKTPERFIQKIPLNPDKIEERKSLQKSLKGLEDLLDLFTKPRDTTRKTVPYHSIQDTLDTLTPIENKTKELHYKKDSLEEELGSVGRYERILKVFAPMISKLGSFKSIDTLGITIERSKIEVLELLEEEINKATSGSYMLYKRSVDDKLTGVLIAHSKSSGDDIKKLLTGKAINEVVLPDDYRELPFLIALTKMVTKKEEIPGKIKEVNLKLNSISGEWYKIVLGARTAILDALEELGTINYCGGSKHSFIIEGWLPKGKLYEVKESFEETFRGNVMVRELAVSEIEEANTPVLIKNTRIVRPFEIFLGFLPTPHYRSVDPTPWIAIFFPIFFGLIVGDLGYGAVLFLIGIYLRHRLSKKPLLRDMMEIMCVSALSAMIFGAIFGELFGNIGKDIGAFTHPLFDRAHTLKVFLSISIGIGVGHIFLGLIIATINYLGRRKFVKALEKASMLFLLTSFLLIIAMKLDFLPSIATFPLIISSLVFLVLLIVLEGVLGVVEFIKAISNILSYTRIMAVGTASVVLALIANKAGSMVDNIVLGITITVLFHTVNIMLSVVTPSVQSLRLQYVEFLSKFYEGGGKKYLPFKKND